MTYKFISFVGFDMYHAMSSEQEAKSAMNRPVPTPAKPAGDGPKKILDDTASSGGKTGGGGSSAPSAAGTGASSGGCWKERRRWRVCRCGRQRRSRGWSECWRRRSRCAAGGWGGCGWSCCCRGDRSASRQGCGHRGPESGVCGRWAGRRPRRGGEDTAPPPTPNTPAQPSPGTARATPPSAAPTSARGFRVGVCCASHTGGSWKSDAAATVDPETEGITGHGPHTRTRPPPR